MKLFDIVVNNLDISIYIYMYLSDSVNLTLVRYDIEIWILKRKKIEKSSNIGKVSGY